MTEAEKIRCSNDRDLFDALSRDPTIVRIKEKIARIEDDVPFRTRRRLLATAVRLSPAMAPSLRSMADECIEKLGVALPLELFVFPSPQYNAMCFRPEEGRLLVMFSSALLEDFEGSEIVFVVGHELGHHVYAHHDIPIGFVLRGDKKPDPRLALSLFAWSRYAEISADRAGAYCAGDQEGVARALFKLASGLSGRTISFQLADFLSQVDQMQEEDADPGVGATSEDWFSTHPFSPLRVKALELFHRSELVNSAGTNLAQLEISVQKLMSLMEPSYLEAKTEAAEAMRRLLFAGTLTVARADGEITQGEVAVFEEFFGTGAFKETFDVTALEEDLDNRIDRVKEVAGVTQAMQVLQDLCIVARAEGHAMEPERLILEDIATKLGLSASFVTRTLEVDLSPD
ncbi:MAG: M48 family metallopeptidase [Pseudomonadota bacterium]|nr:M48 family metallopeptidase [Pseudomonadota bacterium]